MFYVELKQRKLAIKTSTRLIYFLIVESKSNHHIPNVRFLNALTARAMATKSFCFRRARCIKYAGDYSTINCPQEEIQVKCVLCEDNYPANYKDCIIYKDLQRNFFSTLGRKVVTSVSKPGIESVNIQTRHVQPGRLCASVIRTDQAIKY